MSTPSTVEVATISFNNQNETTTNVEVSKSRYQWLRTYFSKWTGQHKTLSPPAITLSDCIVTFFGTFVGIAILAVVHYRLLFRHDLAFFVASFGASAVLLYGIPLSPLSQPRNLIGGQVIGAIVGCVVRLLFGTNGELFVAVSVTVVATTFFMQITGTVHAPAGATALIIVISPTAYPWAGFQYVLMPVLSGSLILLLVAVVINNLVSDRHYPCCWW